MMTISTVSVPNTIKMLASHKLQSTLAVRYVITNLNITYH
jgi:23S rRNA (adenine2503-C2)-methyltransferase